METSATNEIVKFILHVNHISNDDQHHVPPGIDHSTGVNSKDVIISPETNLSARLYLPKTPSPNHKLPLLIFYHGGGFYTESAFSSLYHNFLNLIVSDSNAVAISVEYRLAPEFHLPIAYEDSWEAILWVADHVNQKGPEPWLNEYADLQNIFLAGDSAGGNIAHNMGMRVGSHPPSGLHFPGAILLHPFFWGSKLVGSEAEWMEEYIITHLNELWPVVYPASGGLDHPDINPGMDPNLAGMGCSKILICISGNDFMRERGWKYKRVIEESGRKGDLEVVEDEDEEHVFFLNYPFSENACTLRNRICTFINGA